MIGEVLAQVARASMLGNQGDVATARQLLDQAWAAAASGPALLRCAVAHAVADVQDDPARELVWDERALAEALAAADEPAPEGMPPLVVLLPSLHLNLADVHRRRGDAPAARHHVVAGRAAVEALAVDQAQPHIAAALDRVAGALGCRAADAEARLPSSGRTDEPAATDVPRGCAADAEAPMRTTDIPAPARRRRHPHATAP